jgi:hypothetical protein
VQLALIELELAGRLIRHAGARIARLIHAHEPALKFGVLTPRSNRLHPRTHVYT